MNKHFLTMVAGLALLSTASAPSGAAAGLSSLESDELQVSYSLVTSEFYRKVDQQTLLDGAHAQLVAFLIKNGVKAPVVPTVHALDNPALNSRGLQREVESVVNTYGSKLGSRDLTYAAISGVLASGLRTADIQGEAAVTVSTTQMGDAIVAALELQEYGIRD